VSRFYDSYNNFAVRCRDVAETDVSYEYSLDYKTCSLSHMLDLASLDAIICTV
jgi:hypothetical protein